MPAPWFASGYACHGVYLCAGVHVWPFQTPKSRSLQSRGLDADFWGHVTLSWPRNMEWTLQQILIYCHTFFLYWWFIIVFTYLCNTMAFSSSGGVATAATPKRGSELFFWPKSHNVWNFVIARWWILGWVPFSRTVRTARHGYFSVENAIVISWLII